MLGDLAYKLILELGIHAKPSEQPTPNWNLELLSVTNRVEQRHLTLELKHFKTVKASLLHQRLHSRRAKTRSKARAASS